MTGKRMPDGHSGHLLQPGEYVKHESGFFYACSPTGLLANLGGHTVDEHEDGTITAWPSIRVWCGDKEWHGYLKRGVWTEC